MLAAKGVARRALPNHQACACYVLCAVLCCCCSCCVGSLPAEGCSAGSSSRQASQPKISGLPGLPLFCCCRTEDDADRLSCCCTAQCAHCTGAVLPPCLSQELTEDDAEKLAALLEKRLGKRFDDIGLEDMTPEVTQEVRTVHTHRVNRGI